MTCFGRRHGADDQGKEDAAAHKALFGQRRAAIAEVMQVRIIEATAIKTVLMSQRTAAGTWGPAHQMMSLPVRAEVAAERHRELPQRGTSGG